MIMSCTTLGRAGGSIRLFFNALLKDLRPGTAHMSVATLTGLNAYSPALRGVGIYGYELLPVPWVDLVNQTFFRKLKENGTNNKEIDHSYGKMIRPSKRTKSRQSVRKNLSQVEVEQLKGLRKTMKNGLEVMIMVKQNRLTRWHLHPRGTVFIPNDASVDTTDDGADLQRVPFAE
jgi:hypothetical protein